MNELGFEIICAKNSTAIKRSYVPEQGTRGVIAD